MCFLFFIISFKKHHSFQYFFSLFCSQFYLKTILKFQQCGWWEFYGYLSWFMKDTCVVSSSLSTLLFCYLDNVWISKWISPVLLVHHSVKIEITLIYFLWSVTHISFNTYLNTVVFFFPHLCSVCRSAFKPHLPSIIQRLWAHFAESLITAKSQRYVMLKESRQQKDKEGRK